MRDTILCALLLWLLIIAGGVVLNHTLKAAYAAPEVRQAR